jgi:hypothetical protein
MLKKSLFSLLIIFAVSIASFAQMAYTPTQNSKEAKEILGVLKTKIDSGGEKNAIISTYFFKISGNWAYLQGIPKRNATVEQEAHNVKALLKKSDGRWNVIKYLVGSNDLAYLGWDKEFNASKEIFPKAVRANGKSN